MCCAGAVLWDEEVRGKSVCQILPIGELLQPRQPLLAELRFLSLLHEGWSQDAAPVLKMKSTRQRGQADLEPVYYPHMLQIFQVRAMYLRALLTHCACPQVQFGCPSNVHLHKCELMY